MPVILKLSSGERASLNSLARRNDDVAEAIMDLADNSLTAGIHTGLMLAVPTAASTQATGTGATVWNIGLEKGVVIVDGVAKEFAAQDVAVHSATQLVADGQSCVAAVIARNVAGTITVISVKGAAATT